MSSESKKRNTGLRNAAKEWIKSIGIAFISSIIITTYLFTSVEVKGNSMLPTLAEGDRLILKKYEVLLKTEEYKRGDIIIFESPMENDDDFLVKRVIGLPGDRINILNGELYINDESIEEPYIEKDTFTESLLYGDNYTVSENQLFVMGDNRRPGKSNDSRSFGGISFEEVHGKIVLRLLPLNKLDTDL